MSIDILNMAKYESNPQAIDIALPVFAVECEANPPIKNHLDAYQEAVLRFVGLGLSSHGIATTLNATESLIDEILDTLEGKKYVIKETGKPWMLTEDGMKYIDGEVQERESKESVYGYMFINAIKKEVLPFFYSGDIGRIDTFYPNIQKINLSNDETVTFEPINLKQQKLRSAYKQYMHNRDISEDYNEGNITKEEAIDLFEEIDSFDEDSYDEPATTVELHPQTLSKNMFIRPLKKEPVKYYLRMRLIIDPSYPGGYRAESPFDFGGIDNNYFLKQLQWFENSEDVYISDEIFAEYLNREICKISPAYKNCNKDFSVFVLERMPLLKQYRARLPYVYEDMERIFNLMQQNITLLEKENIVQNITRSVIEGIMNSMFRLVNKTDLNTIRNNAYDDITAYGHGYKNTISRNLNLNKDLVYGISVNYLKTIVNRLNYTFGNSTMEKFINMMVVDYHLGNKYIHRFLTQNDINQLYKTIDKLNQIRRKVSHDTDERFTDADYDYYMSNVFNLINNLLDAYREDL